MRAKSLLEVRAQAVSEDIKYTCLCNYTIHYSLSSLSALWLLTERERREDGNAALSTVLQQSVPSSIYFLNILAFIKIISNKSLQD